tara:strand:+ start:804 stop:1049 length:246 start_codon:yes stop_codon:yes gene_type:complete
MNKVTNISDSRLHKLLEENKLLKKMLYAAGSEIKYIHDVYMAGDTDYLENGNLYNPEDCNELVAKAYSYMHYESYTSESSI